MYLEINNSARSWYQFDYSNGNDLFADLNGSSSKPIISNLKGTRTEFLFRQTEIILLSMHSTTTIMNSTQLKAKTPTPPTHPSTHPHYTHPTIHLPTHHKSSLQNETTSTSTLNISPRSTVEHKQEDQMFGFNWIEIGTSIKHAFWINLTNFLWLYF